MIEQEPNDNQKKNQELERGFRQLQKLEPNKVSNFDLYFTLIKFDMKGTDQQKDEQIRKRISKFFDYGQKSINLQQHEHFCEKREPNTSQSDFQTIPNQLIVFGVDFLSKKTMRKRFSGLHTQVVTLDDSHYKVIFENDQDAFKAIEMNIRDPTILKVKAQQQQSSYPMNWFQLKPYYEMTFERKLWCRYATNNQNEESIIQSQKHILFKNARKKFREQVEPQVKEMLQRRQFGGLFNRDRDREDQRSGRYGNRDDRDRSREKYGTRYRDNNDRRQRNNGRREYSNEKNDKRDNGRGNRRQNQNDRNRFSYERENKRPTNNLDESDQSEYSIIITPQELEKQLMKMAINQEVSDIPNRQNYEIQPDQSPEISLEMDSQIHHNNNNTNPNYDLDIDNDADARLSTTQNINTSFSYIDYINNQQRQQQERLRRNKVKIIVIDSD